MHLGADQAKQVARLFGFLVLGERLAHVCARAQASIASDRAAQRFLVTQARQEAFHTRVFEGAILSLNPRGIEASPALATMDTYGAMVQEAIERHDLSETLLAQQVILEGLGDVVCEHIDNGIAWRGIGFARLRRLVVHQEHAHHAFGVRRLAQLVCEDPDLTQRLRPRGRDYLGLVHEMLASVSDLFEYFDEDAAAYTAELHRRRDLPAWLFDSP